MSGNLKRKSGEKKLKKALNIIKNIIVWPVVVFAVLMTLFTIISVNTFNRNDRQIMGYKLYIVDSDSMSKTDFSAGDLIMVKEVDPSTLKEGDIITYISQNGASFGETVTHKIRKLTTDARGNPGFVTYGTTTDTDDETIVTYMYVLGKYENKIPKLGYFFNFMKTPAGYIICIFIPFMILIIYQGVRCFMLFRKYKKQQLDDMQTERDQLATEREKNEQILAELKELKAKLDGQVAATETAGAVSSSEASQEVATGKTEYPASESKDEAAEAKDEPVKPESSTDEV